MAFGLDFTVEIAGENIAVVEEAFAEQVASSMGKKRFSLLLLTSH